LLSFNFSTSTFYQKLNIYKKLINLEFKKDFALLNKKPKYLLTNLYPERESFRNRTANKKKVKLVNNFSINLKNIKSIYKILDKELYIMYLVRFLNKNIKIYKDLHGNN